MRPGCHNPNMVIWQMGCGIFFGIFPFLVFYDFVNMIFGRWFLVGDFWSVIRRDAMHCVSTYHHVHPTYHRYIINQQTRYITFIITPDIRFEIFSFLFFIAIIVGGASGHINRYEVCQIKLRISFWYQRFKKRKVFSIFFHRNFPFIG